MWNFLSALFADILKLEKGFRLAKLIAASVIAWYSDATLMAGDILTAPNTVWAVFITCSQSAFSESLSLINIRTDWTSSTPNPAVTLLRFSARCLTKRGWFFPLSPISGKRIKMSVDLLNLNSDPIVANNWLWRALANLFSLTDNQVLWRMLNLWKITLVILLKKIY